MTRIRIAIAAFALSVAAFGCGDDDDDDNTPDAGATLDAAATFDAAQVGWEQVGGRVSPSGAESEDPAMLLVGGTPAVGYRHASFEVNLHVLSGGQWGTSEADPTGGNTIASIYRAPDFCAQGNSIYMAYGHAGDGGASDDTFYDRVFAYRWTSGGGWVAMNGGAEVSEIWDSVAGIGYGADEASVACAPGGDVAVGWVETDRTAEEDIDAFVAAVDDSTATTSPRINRTAANITDVRTLDVEIDGNGDYYVAQLEEAADASFDSNLYVTRYDGSTTTAVGGAIDTDGDTNTLSAPSLVALADDDLYVAWSAQRSGADSHDIYVARWQGSDWTELGGGAIRATGTAHFDAGNPDLIVIDGVPTLAWNESDDDGTYIFVAQLVGGSWELIGDRINVDPAREALDPSLAYDADAGVLYVAFEEFVDGYAEIFVKRRPL